MPYEKLLVVFLSPFPAQQQQQQQEQKNSMREIEKKTSFFVVVVFFFVPGSFVLSFAMKQLTAPEMNCNSQVWRDRRRWGIPFHVLIATWNFKNNKRTSSFGC